MRDVSVTLLRIGAEELAILTYSRSDDFASVRLTVAETEVVSLIQQGLSNSQIARARGSATRTVANQVATLFRKFEVRSRAELAAILAGAATKR